VDQVPNPKLLQNPDNIRVRHRANVYHWHAVLNSVVMEVARET